MAKFISKAAGVALSVAMLATVTGLAATGTASADEAATRTPIISTQQFRRDTPSQRGRDRGQYIPEVTLTPDGCEVWVIDDGAEGYGDNRLTRKGTPICHDVTPCGVLNTDQFFATDSYRIRAAQRASLARFFQQSTAFAYTIVGHTDSRASDDYNLRLSYNRANAVAQVAASVGAKIVDVRGLGERYPVASNATRDGMARNRRVEILCFQ